MSVQVTDLSTVRVCPQCENQNLVPDQNGRPHCSRCTRLRDVQVDPNQIKKMDGEIGLKPIQCPNCGMEMRLSVSWSRMRDRDFLMTRCSSLVYAKRTTAKKSSQVEGTAPAQIERDKGCGRTLYVQYYPDLQVHLASANIATQSVFIRLAGHMHAASLVEPDVGPAGRANLLVTHSTNPKVYEQVCARYPSIDPDEPFFYFVAPQGSGEGQWTDETDDHQIYALYQLNVVDRLPAIVTGQRGEFADLYLIVPRSERMQRQLLRAFPDVNLESKFHPIHGVRRKLSQGGWWPSTPPAGIPVLPLLDGVELQPVGDVPEPTTAPRLVPYPDWVALSVGRWQRSDGLLMSLSEGTRLGELVVWLSHKDVDNEVITIDPNVHQGSLYRAAELLDPVTLDQVFPVRVRTSRIVGGWRLGGMEPGQDHKEVWQHWTRPALTGLGPNNHPGYKRLAAHVRTDEEGRVHWLVVLPFSATDAPSWADILRETSEVDPTRNLRQAVSEAKRALDRLIDQRDQEDVEQASKHEVAPAPHLPADPTDLPERPALPDPGNPSDPGLPYEVDPEGAAW